MQHQSGSQSYGRTLYIAFLLVFSLWAPMFAVPPIDYLIRDSLAISHAQSGFLFSAPLLMVVVAAIPAGLMVDRIGIKRSAIFGMAAVAIGTILRGTATSYGALLGFSFVYGIGIGWTFPILPKLVSSMSGSRERAGINTGIYNSGLYIGCALAAAITVPLLVPITNSFSGVFFIWSIPAIISGILCWFLYHEGPHVNTRTTTLAALSQVVKNNTLWRVAGLLLLNNIFFYSWTGWAPQLLRDKGATAALAGIITSLLLWIAIPSSFFIPRLAFKMGVRKPFLWGSSLALSALSLAAIYMNLPLSWLVVALVGAANTTRFITILALPVEMVPPEKVGAASGLILSVGYIGAIIGPLISGVILDMTGSLDIAMFMLVGVSLGAAAMAWILPETGNKVLQKTAYVTVKNK